MKSVKIGLGLFIMFVFSFSPLIYVFNVGGPISGYFRFTYYINSVGNFFIYLAVDEEFRAKLRQCVRCN